METILETFGGGAFKKIGVSEYNFKLFFVPRETRRGGKSLSRRAIGDSDDTEIRPACLVHSGHSATWRGHRCRLLFLRHVGDDRFGGEEE